MWLNTSTEVTETMVLRLVEDDFDFFFNYALHLHYYIFLFSFQSSTSPMDSLGLLITLILGGLGMFLLVLAVTFLAAKTITKNDFERFTDLEDNLVETDEFLDVSEHSRDIFIIDDGETSSYLPESLKNPMLSEMVKETKVAKS